MTDDNSRTGMEEVSFIIRMAQLMPALGIGEQVTPISACQSLGLTPTTRNVALLRDIQSYRQLVWSNLPISTRLEIAFGDNGAPSDFDFYFDRDVITEDDLFG